MARRKNLWRKNVELLALDLLAHGAQPLSARPDRVIALIGAGASAPAGVLTAELLKERIKRVIIEDRQLNEHVLQMQLSPGGKQTISDASLEEFTQVACRFAYVRDLVVGEVGRICLSPLASPGKSLPPLLGYEIVAHLVKHGFIDHVISMNFDEILDQALENELGEALLKIVSERDAMIAKRPKQWMSCLVKPHGTISAPLSLRFTREDVKMFPDEIKEFVERELLPPVDVCDSAPVTLIIIGFSMRDEVLAGILRAANIARVYRIDTVMPKAGNKTSSRGPRALKEVFRQLPAATGVNRSLQSLERFIVSRRGVNVLAELWDMMERHADKKNLTLVSIARHHILSEMFGRRRNGDKVLPTIDNRQRLELELLLAIAKAKGKFNTYNLARSGRVHRYFDDGRPASNVAVFKRMVEEKNGILVNEHRGHGYEGENFLTRDFKAATDYVWKFAKENGVESKSERKFKQWYRDVKDDEEVEVSRAPDARNKWQFEAADPIHTMAELHQVTRRLLLNPEANRLLVVCETGDWLQRDWVGRIMDHRLHKRAPRLDCEMIIIHQDEIAPFAKGGMDYGLGFAIEPVPGSESKPNPIRLHWWEHNRHLTLAVKVSANGRKVKLLEGIYFRRRLNQPLIAPVYISAPADLKNLLGIFRRYRRKFFRRTIRVIWATESHLDLIDEVGRDAYKGQNPGWREMSERIRGSFANPRQTTLLACYESENGEPLVVGVLSFVLRQKTVDFLAVGVRREWQGNGVARILIEKMEQIARQSAAAWIHLIAGEYNLDYLMRRGYEVSKGVAADRYQMKKQVPI